MHSNHHHQLSPSPPSTGKPPRPPPPHQPQPPLSISIPSHSDPPTQPNDSPHSPLRSESDATSAPQTAIVAVEKYYSPLTSPLPVTPPPPSSSPPTVDPTTQDNSLHHIISFNRREEAPPQTAVVKRVGFRDLKSGGGVGVGFGGGGGGGVLSKVGLGFRVLEVVVCLVSFSVMASDKTQGWSGDSFDRYNEYRFCLTVTIMGFVYSGFQAFDLAYHMSSGKHVITHHLRYQFDFIADQILAYLLISASSAAATRVNDWVLNWGKDEFTEKVSASISMAFIAFACFATSSLISGYNLCNRDIS